MLIWNRCAATLATHVASVFSFGHGLANFRTVHIKYPQLVANLHNRPDAAIDRASLSILQFAKNDFNEVRGG